MNEKELIEQRKQDMGLKAAMKRRDMNRPQMPKGLNEKVMQKAAEPSRQKKSYWRWAAAACLLIAIGIGVSYQFSETPRTLTQKSTDFHTEVHGLSHRSPRTVTQKSTDSYTEVHGQLTQTPQPISQPAVATEEQVLEIRVPADETEPKVVYASVAANKDTIVKAPARMEEFVEKMAEYCKAEKADLDCLKIGEDSTQNRMYVIEDTPENEVFGRLIQMAVWYDNDAPGYFLTFSHDQFLFQLHDLQLNLKYFVVAERISAKRILLYSTHIPLGSQFSMACYLEYKSKLNNGQLIIEN